MLSRTHRLRAAEVREVLSRGRSRRGTALSVKMLASTSSFRSAVVVSKKVAKTAVLRNKVRRAAYRALAQASLPPTGRAILFVQAIPKDNLQTTFLAELKKLLNV